MTANASKSVFIFCIEVLGKLWSERILEEVLCKEIIKAGVDINADDIEDCQRFGNKGQTVTKFRKRKVSRQVLRVSERSLTKLKWAMLS